MANLPRIRSAKEAADELRKLDPGTKFCEHHIRYLMRYLGRPPPVCQS